MTGELAVPDQPDRARAELAALTYDGPSSVGDAADRRTRVAAIAELAKRAGQDEVQWMLAAREAERALGRMLVAGREAGDVASASRPRSIDRADTSTLRELGIAPDLAADAVVFAAVPDDVWVTWVGDVGEDRDRATQSAFVRIARDYVAAQADPSYSRPGMSVTDLRARFLASNPAGSHPPRVARIDMLERLMEAYRLIARTVDELANAEGSPSKGFREGASATVASIRVACDHLDAVIGGGFTDEGIAKLLDGDDGAAS